MTTSMNLTKSETTTDLSPFQRDLQQVADRLRQLGVADLLPDGQLVTAPVLLAAARELQWRVQRIYTEPSQLGRYLSEATAMLDRGDFVRGDFDRAVDALDAVDRERARLDQMRAARAEQDRKEAEERAKPAPAAWRELDADAPAVIDRDVLAARLANKRYVLAHLMTKRDERLVDLGGEVDDALRRMTYALGPVAPGSAFYATADVLMPKRAPFTSPALAANETAPSWLVKLAADIGSIPFPSPPTAPSVSSLRRTGDPFADQAAERDAHEGYTAALDAWRDDSARAHEALAGRIEVALDALTPGCFEAFWLHELRCHVTGQRAIIERDIVLRALSMTSVWRALVEPTMTPTSKTDTTKATKHSKR